MIGNAEVDIFVALGHGGCPAGRTTGATEVWSVNSAEESPKPRSVQKKLSWVRSSELVDPDSTQHADAARTIQGRPDPKLA